MNYACSQHLFDVQNVSVAQNFQILTFFTIKMSKQNFLIFLKKIIKMAFPGFLDIAKTIVTKNQLIWGIQ